MQINFPGQQLELTPPLRQFTEEKLERLNRHFDRIINIDVTFAVEKKLKQTVKVSVHSAGANFHASASSENMYSAVDHVVDMLDKQIKKHKEKNTSHRE